MSALKPCPFCGGEAKGEWSGASADDPYVITCPRCPATMIAYGDSDHAITAWNRRTGDDEVERLREALRWLATDSVDPDSRRIANAAIRASAVEVDHIAEVSKMVIAEPPHD